MRSSFKRLEAEIELSFEKVFNLVYRNAFYIDSDKRNRNKEKLGKLPVGIKPYFKSYVELDPIIVNKGTLKERKFWVFYCKDYQQKK